MHLLSTAEGVVGGYETEQAWNLFCGNLLESCRYKLWAQGGLHKNYDAAVGHIDKGATAGCKGPGNWGCEEKGQG